MIAEAPARTARYALVIGPDRAFGLEVIERLRADGFVVIADLAALPEDAVLGTLIVNLLCTEQKTPFRSLSDALFRTMLDNQLYLFFDSIQAAVPRMSSGATIVQIAPKSFLGAWGGVHAAASAAACIAMARSMAIEFRSLDIRVNSVAVERADAAGVGASVAATVAWLASADSDRVNGETILADRGASLQMVQAVRR